MSRLVRLQGAPGPDALSRLQDNIQQAMDRLPLSPTLGPVGSPASVTFTSATAIVSHGLGRAPSGFLVGRRSVQGTAQVYCDVTFVNPQPTALDAKQQIQLATNLSPAPTKRSPLVVEGWWI